MVHIFWCNVQDGKCRGKLVATCYILFGHATSEASPWQLLAWTSYLAGGLESTSWTRTRHSAARASPAYAACLFCTCADGCLDAALAAPAYAARLWRTGCRPISAKRSADGVMASSTQMWSTCLLRGHGTCLEVPCPEWQASL